VGPTGDLVVSEQDVQLIVGLGNPGAKYENNRHNLGFKVVEELARRRELEFQDQGANYLVAAGPQEKSGLVLLMPLTYMNLSGEAVEQWSLRAGVEVTGRPVPPVSDPAEAQAEEDGDTVARESGIRPLVVCDDLNLPLGSVRLRPRGSSGGQNGLASVITHLGGDEFPRLRLGVAPLDGEVDPAEWPDYVLADFDNREKPAADELVSHAADALEFWLEKGLEATISRFNRRVRPESGPPTE
jgi:PTH1 family peptidyl-tRNA hydrolase